MKEDHSALMNELDARLENIKAIKGNKYALAVQAAVNIHNIMQVGSSRVPEELRRIILPDACASQIKYLCQLIDLSREDALELTNLAKSICEQAERKLNRIRHSLD